MVELVSFFFLLLQLFQTKLKFWISFTYSTTVTKRKDERKGTRNKNNSSICKKYHVSSRKNQIIIFWTLPRGKHLSSDFLMKKFFHFLAAFQNLKNSAVFITSVTAFLLVLDLAFTRCYRCYAVSLLN